MKIQRPKRSINQKIATTNFIAVDGEGINIGNSPEHSHINMEKCIECDKDLTNDTRYRIDEQGPYCRKDYFLSKGIVVNLKDREPYAPSPDGHEYVLFCVGNIQIENPQGLQWYEIFELIYAEHMRYTAFCGFYLRYDFNCILRTMPVDRVKRLVTIEGKNSRVSTSKVLRHMTLPVDMPDGWQIDMLGMRLMKIRRRACSCDLYACGCPGKGPWLTICDVGPFYQKAFLAVIDPEEWDNDPEIKMQLCDLYPIILKGKEDRAAATKVTAEMRLYNRTECIALSLVMNSLNKGFRNRGIILPPGDWTGPGRAVDKWLRKINAPTKEDMVLNVPDSFIQMARDTYIAGWFELMMHGIVPGTTVTYDINSAYPSYIKDLLSNLKEHGDFESGNGESPDLNDKYTMVYAQVWSDNTLESGHPNVIGTMLHRDKEGHIFRPSRTEGAFHLAELMASKKAGCIDGIRYIKWERFVPNAHCTKPFKEIEDLYYERIRLGKNSPEGKAIKLVCSSTYGKLAQSIGNPVFANPYYASKITSSCRTSIIEAIGSHPGGNFPPGQHNVVMVNTDSATFMDKHNELVVSKNLGEWESSEHDDLVIASLGVYWYKKTLEDIEVNEPTQFKCKGFSARDFSKNLRMITLIFMLWQHALTDEDFEFPEEPGAYGRDGNVMLKGWPVIEFHSGFAMTSALQAIIQDDWSKAGYVDQNKKIRFNANPSLKRRRLAIRQGKDSRLIWSSFPWNLSEDACISERYKKKFGLDDPWSEENIDEFGINQEGLVGDGIKNILGLGDE